VNQVLRLVVLALLQVLVRLVHQVLLAVLALARLLAAQVQVVRALLVALVHQVLLLK